MGKDEFVYVVTYFYDIEFNRLVMVLEVSFDILLFVWSLENFRIVIVDCGGNNKRVYL